MNTKLYFNEIRSLLGKNNFKEAFKLLQQLLDKSPKLNEVIHQLGRYHYIKRLINQGAVSFENETITINKIRIALLGLLTEIENSQNDEAIKEEIENAVIKINKSKNILINSQIFADGNIHIGNNKININQPYFEQEIIHLLTDLPFLINRTEQDRAFLSLRPKGNRNYHGLLISKKHDLPFSYLRKLAFYLNNWIHTAANSHLATPLFIHLGEPKEKYCKSNRILEFLDFCELQKQDGCRFSNFFEAVEVLKKRENHIIFCLKINRSYIKKNYESFLKYYFNLWEKVPPRKNGYSLLNILIIENSERSWLFKQFEVADKIHHFYQHQIQFTDPKQICFCYPKFTNLDNEDLSNWLQSNELQKVPLLVALMDFIKENLSKKTPLSMNEFKDLLGTTIKEGVKKYISRS
ncbi:MAG: hypothetical protein AAFO82_07675 [Bacteroidota bacterium]